MTTDWYQEVILDEWDQALHLRKHLTMPWMFRGQAQADWMLTTSLERAVPVPWADNRDEILDNEQDILEELQLVAPNYDIHTPPGSGSLEWLALLQHHGGATRLLDATASFFVAAFFASETPDATPTIWCFQPFRMILGAHLITTNVTSTLDPFDDDRPGGYERAREFANNLIDTSIGRSCPYNAAVPVEPRFRSERMLAQQGLFIATTDPGLGLEDGIAASARAGSESPAPVGPLRYSTIESEWDTMWPHINEASVLKLVINREARDAILNDLEEMNVGARSLFPGFDGFARALKQELRDLSPSPERLRKLRRGFTAAGADYVSPLKRRRHRDP